MCPCPPQGIISRVSPRTATIVVAASNSATKSKIGADYICDGVHDEVEIQNALNSLPAGGGKVVLLEGTYHVEATINLNSNQTLSGCGRNTILTTSTRGLIFLSAVGGSGTEKTGIFIADLQIDGALESDCGIYFQYVDYSLIQNVYSRRHQRGYYWAAIVLLNSDFNTIIESISQETGWGIYLESSDNNTISGNTCQGNGHGIYLESSNNNTISGNTCQGNDHGIYLYSASNNTISGNTCQGNDYGIYLYSASNNTISGNICQGTRDGIWLYSSNNNNTISGNTCQGNGRRGIRLDSSNNNTISGNTCVENSQESNNSYDDIYLAGSDYNNIQGNTCRAGALTNKPRYGINISNAACDGNLVTNNDLYDDGFGTGAFRDAGTGTVTTPGNRT